MFQGKVTKVPRGLLMHFGVGAGGTELAVPPGLTTLWLVGESGAMFRSTLVLWLRAVLARDPERGFAPRNDFCMQCHGQLQGGTLAWCFSLLLGQGVMMLPCLLVACDPSVGLNTHPLGSFISLACALVHACTWPLLDERLGLLYGCVASHDVAVPRVVHPTWCPSASCLLALYHVGLRLWYPIFVCMRHLTRHDMTRSMMVMALT